MIFEAANRLRVYPLASVVKIGDTPADIQEGLNAGVWSIGVAGTGNMVGLSQADFEALPSEEREIRLTEARSALQSAGAHFVIDSVADLDPVLEEIESILRRSASDSA
jgi:phosphonoacetaldehyde hydrolase